MKKKVILVGVLISFLVTLTSCALFERRLQTEKEPPIAAAATPADTEEPASEPLTKYSATPNFAPTTDRQYKRMTRERMEDESDLQAGAGSLWVMEGQTSYLFAQNKQRREGDPTAIRVEGSALKQIEMKVSTISDLLKQLEDQKKKAEEDEKKAAQEKLRLAEVEKEKTKLLDTGEAKDDAAALALAEKKVKERMPASDKKAEVAAKPEKEEKIDLKDIEFIPSRIVEKMQDGYYRVTGQQYLTIKKRPYKVIATGMVRPEDFDDKAVSSNKMYESSYDVIHMKKSEKQ